MGESMSRSDDLTFVRWKGGVWKVIDHDPNFPSNLKIRWVCGSRPDRGIFQDVAPYSVERLTDMEVIAIAADEDIVL